jgi:hypothetical protein
MDTDGRSDRPVSSFAESDYRFGLGLLRMRVQAVDWSVPQDHDGALWYEVDGIEMTEDGREIQRRRVLVKAARLLRPTRDRSP